MEEGEVGKHQAEPQGPGIADDDRQSHGGGGVDPTEESD